MVRALASHQSGPGSNPGVDAICGLSLLLVLSLAPRGFSPGTPVFPSPQKPTFPNSSSTRNQVDEEPLCGCATSKSLMFIIYLISQFTCLSNLLWVKLSKTLARQLVNAIGLRCDLISRGGEIFGTGVIINLFKESGRNPSCNDRL